MDTSKLRTGRFFLTLSFGVATTAVILFLLFKELGRRGGSAGLVGGSIALCIGLCLAALQLYAFFRPPRLDGQPWLARQDWRNRRVVSQAGVKDFYFALGFGVFGLIAVFPLVCLAMGLPVSIQLFVSLFVIPGSIAVFLLYLWLKQRKFGDSVCLLETLPGVIGGWFKATVEVTLPLEPPSPLTITLVNFVMAGKWRTTIWETSRPVWAKRIPGPRDNQYQIPVRLQIPDGQKDYATWSRLGGGGWELKVRAELPGIDFSAAFPVPIYRTDKAPPDEQRPDGEPAR